MSLLDNERLIPLGRVREDVDCKKFLPRRRQRQLPSESWFFRMTKRPGVKLETVRVGGTLCTSPQAIRRFFAALARERDGAVVVTTDVSAEHAAAELELTAAGI